MVDFSDFFLGLFLWIVLTGFFFSIIYSPTQTNREDSVSKLKALIADKDKQIEDLLAKLQQQNLWRDSEFKQASFKELESLLVNYPTVCQKVENNSDLPAQDILPLFTISLENLLESWNYQAIGVPGEQVEYNPILHQADSAEIQPGELVYIRQVGYQEGENIVVPAKISRRKM